MDFDAAKRVLAAFEREGVRYAVFGGAALNHTVRPKDRMDAEVLRQRFRFQAD